MPLGREQSQGTAGDEAGAKAAAALVRAAGVTAIGARRSTDVPAGAAVAE